jgi:hypothetical protein
MSDSDSSDEETKAKRAQKKALLEKKRQEFERSLAQANAAAAASSAATPTPTPVAGKTNPEPTPPTPSAQPALVQSASEVMNHNHTPVTPAKGSGNIRRLSATVSASQFPAGGLMATPVVNPLLSPKNSVLGGGGGGGGSFQENTVDLVYFFSCPLVVAPAGSTAEPIPLKLLDIPGEITLLKETFDAADRQVRVKFDWGCVENLRSSVTTRCRAIHYSGHGFPSGLAFEDKAGSAHMFEAIILRNLVAAGDQTVCSCSFF